MRLFYAFPVSGWFRASGSLCLPNTCGKPSTGRYLLRRVTRGGVAIPGPRLPGVQDETGDGGSSLRVWKGLPFFRNPNKEVIHFLKSFHLLKNMLQFPLLVSKGIYQGNSQGASSKWWGASYDKACRVNQVRHELWAGEIPELDGCLLALAKAAPSKRHHCFVVLVSSVTILASLQLVHAPPFAGAMLGSTGNPGGSARFARGHLFKRDVQASMAGSSFGAQIWGSTEN